MFLRTSVNGIFLGNLHLITDNGRANIQKFATEFMVV